MPKKSLRRVMLDRRAGLATEEWAALSRDVQHVFLGSDHYERAGVIALYAAVNREVDTAEVLVMALAAGKRVLFPVVEGGSLRFREVTGMHDFVAGAFGIAEPGRECPEYLPEHADCIVVPGVAFDMNGRRIGYGKGYYDRTLHHLEGTGRLIGFSFEFQLVDEIVGEPHDVALDLIITERRMLPVRSL